MALSSAQNIPLLILGSARRDSETALLANMLMGQHKYKFANLLDYSISPYAYSGIYPSTDTFDKISILIQQHEKLILATPVYWYAMSGLMKIFFDRLTDLVTINKPTGRSLKGKKIFVLAVGSDEELPLGFEEPFRLTAAYFEMSYGGCYYCLNRKLANPQDTAPFLEWLYT